MKTYMGFWDLLFGDKIKVEFADGRSRTVTKKWVAKMEKQGLMKPIDDNMIKVHILDPFADLLHLINPKIKKSGHYRQEFWAVGKDVPLELVEKYKDRDNGELYVLMGKPDGAESVKPYVIDKGLWSEAKQKMDAIDG